MKRQQLKETRAKSPKELISTVVTLKDEMKKIAMERNAGRMKNVSLLGKKKRELSQLLTLLREKEMIPS